MYPPVFLAYGVSGIAGPWTGGWFYNTRAIYISGIAVGLAVVVAGLLASGWLLRRARAIDFVAVAQVSAALSRRNKGATDG